MGGIINFQVGESYRAKLGHFLKPKRVHVRAIVDGYVVIKWYGTHKQWWHYEIVHPETLTWAIGIVSKHPLDSRKLSAAFKDEEEKKNALADRVIEWCIGICNKQVDPVNVHPGIRDDWEDAIKQCILEIRRLKDDETDGMNHD